MSSSEAGNHSRLERLFAALRRRMLGEDQKPGEYFKPLPIVHSAFESQHMESRSWIRPHGRAGNFWDRGR
jgi:hypothetical protein